DARERDVASVRGEIEDADEVLVAGAAAIGEDRLRRVEKFDTAGLQRRLGATPRQQLAIVTEGRARVLVLAFDIERGLGVLDRQPGFAGGKAVWRRAGFPGHGGAAAVAALVAGPEADAARVGQFLKGNVGF